ncbi:SymE family type I addiction module toxin [Robinsoniella peoriensis]|uniref:SymE family type I addiction module toxin n=1 Tax=Robinsoniella peoriensis TaxID=180332 RepID=UPI003752C13A
MKTKKMKVLYSSRARQSSGNWYNRSSYIETPKISMEGKWLEALGFHIGDAIEVSYEDNCIRIAPMPSMVCEEPLDYSQKQKKQDSPQ